jgi:hypothetical protein
VTYETTIAMAVEAAIAEGKTIAEVTNPLVDQIARSIIVGLRRSATPAVRRGARDGMVELIRNNLDEAVARYDQLDPN